MFVCYLIPALQPSRSQLEPIDKAGVPSPLLSEQVRSAPAAAPSARPPAASALMASPRPLIIPTAFLKATPLRLCDLCPQPPPLFPLGLAALVPRLRRQQLLRTATWFGPAPLPPLSRRRLPSLLEGLLPPAKAPPPARPPSLLTLLLPDPSTTASDSESESFITCDDGAASQASLALSLLSKSLATRSPSPAPPPQPRPKPRQAVLLSANINGLRSKRDSIAALLADETPLALCLQETKVTSSVDARLTHLPGFRLIRRDRTQNGGGVAVAVSESFNGHPLRATKLLPSSGSLEAVAARLKLSHSSTPITVVSVYRPPGLSKSASEDFEESLCSFLADLTSSGDRTFLFGDFNLSHGTTESASLEAMLAATGLDSVTPAVPTHGERCLDWAYSNAPTSTPSAASLLPSLEKSAVGHACLRLQLSLQPPPPLRLPKQRIWLWGRTDEAAVQRSLGESGLAAELCSTTDPDAGLACLREHLEQAKEAAVPSAVLSRPGPEQPPWLTSVVLSASDLCRKKHAAFRRVRDATDPDHRAVAFARSEYKAAFQRRKLAIRRARDSFESRIIDEAERDHRLWSVLDRIATKPRRDVSSLLLDGKVVEDSAEIAAALAASFACHHVRPSHPEPSPGPPLPVPASALLNIYDASRLIGNLKRRVAAGPDGVPTSLLKAGGDALAGPIALLLNTVLSSGRIPSAWRQATIVPVPKASSPRSPSDYRPISLLDSLSKLYERRLCDLLRLHCRPLSPLQFAFSAKSGTADALLQLQLKIIQACAECKGAPRVAVLSLDAAKAFDALPHRSILAGLSRSGCPPWLADRVRDWLTGRSAQVRVGDQLSSPFEVPSGAPQGSISGPALFSFAVESLLHLPLSSGAHLQLYADDAVLVRSVQSLEDEAAFRADAIAVVKHLAHLGLRVNATKSAVMVVSGAPTPPSLRQPLLLGGERVPETASVRYLGVLLDRRLNFNAHWAAKAASAKSALGALGAAVRWEKRLLRHLLRERVQAILAYSLLPAAPTSAASWAKVRSVLSYAAHRLGASYALDGDAAIRSAGLTPPEELAQTAHLSFAFDCVFRGRRYGLALERGRSETQLRPVPCRYVSHRQLLPARLPLLWSAAWRQLGDTFPSRPSRDTFICAISQLTLPSL